VCPTTACPARQRCFPSVPPCTALMNVLTTEPSHFPSAITGRKRLVVKETNHYKCVTNGMVGNFVLAFLRSRLECQFTHCSVIGMLGKITFFGSATGSDLFVSPHRLKRPSICPKQSLCGMSLYQCSQHAGGTLTFSVNLLPYVTVWHKVFGIIHFKYECHVTG
jgi:hypothetical protein